MEFFDINCWVNYREIVKENSDFFAGLAKKNIKKVVLTNRLSLVYDWNIGNMEFAKSELHAENDNLYFAFIICPEAYLQFNFADYIKTAYKNRVRIFRVFPKSQLFYLNDFYMNRIYDEMSLVNFPLMIDLKELDITGNKYFAIDDLRALLGRHKKLTVILETSLKQCMFSRFYFPLLEEFENLYIETSGLLLMDQLEHYVERFGSERLVFGSNYPANDISVNTARIQLMESSKTDIGNICFNNINRIFNTIRI